MAMIKSYAIDEIKYAIGIFKGEVMNTEGLEQVIEFIESQAEQLERADRMRDAVKELVEKSKQVEQSSINWKIKYAIDICEDALKAYEEWCQKSRNI